jgi:hypothetical protein
MEYLLAWMSQMDPFPFEDLVPMLSIYFKTRRTSCLTRKQGELPKSWEFFTHLRFEVSRTD